MSDQPQPEPAEDQAAPAASGDGLVQMAYLHPHTVSHSWHESVMRLVMHDQLHNGRLIGTGGPYMMATGSGGIVEGRNGVVQRWLEETPHEWLWFIDTDMGFAPDTVDRLLHAADPAARPVVGALCFGWKEHDYDGMGGRLVKAFPTIYNPCRDVNGHVGFANRTDYPDNTLIQVAGTGAACLLIHRTAAEKVRAEHGDTWFDPVRYGDGRWVSEDLSFCWRLSNQKIPVFVHTGVKTTHHKQIWVSEADYTPPQGAPAHTEMPEHEVPHG